jgi:hypothetical protein
VKAQILVKLQIRSTQDASQAQHDAGDGDEIR